MIVWESAHELYDRSTGDAVSVVKYDDRLRKRVALEVRCGVARTPIAYFMDEDVAIDFCNRFLGGIRKREA